MGGLAHSGSECSWPPKPGRDEASNQHLITEPCSAELGPRVGTGNKREKRSEGQEHGQRLEAGEEVQLCQTPTA